jgi:uncharacterized protein
MSERPTRRKMLLAAGALGAAGAVGGAYWFWKRHRPVPPPSVRLEPDTERGFYRRLGRTELLVSAVGVGAGGLDRPELLVRAVDSGINYVDTAICYGDSERVIAEALAMRPDIREKLVIATKWDADQFMTKAKILESLDRSIERLGVTIIDVMQIHWLGGGHVSSDSGFNRLDNPALYEAMDEARRSGKVRFFGATSHDKNRAAILGHAVDKGAFDVLLVKMNVLDFEDAGMPALLEKARKADVGVVAMKSQPGRGHVPPGYEASKLTAYQANLRWTLEHDIACVVESDIGTDAAMQDAAIEAARAKLGAAERAEHTRWAAAMSPHYCRGCDDACTAACPAGIAIGPVLHFHMYDRGYDRPERARRHYLALAPERRWSERCAECDVCSDACPHGVDASARIRDARVRLG